MNKIKLVTVLLVAVSLFAVVVVPAQSDEALKSTKVKQKVVSGIKTESANIPERAPLMGSRQGYKMVTDELDSFGGESGSDNYRIPVNSGGGPSPIGISESDSFVVKAGFVLASDVKHGDANSDGTVGPGDVVYLINYLSEAALNRVLWSQATLIATVQWGQVTSSICLTIFTEADHHQPADYQSYFFSPSP